MDAQNEEQKPVAAPVPAQKPPLTGVGGWLAFLVISMGVLSPLRMFYGIFSPGSEERPDSLVALLIALIPAAIFMLGAWRLYSRHTWRSVRFAIVALWVGSVGIELVIILAVFLFAGWGAASSLVLTDTESLVRKLFYPTVWTLYLLRSQRVKNTYRRESGMEELARNLGVKK